MTRLEMTPELATRIAADRDLVIRELTNRLDRCTDADRELAFGWLVDNMPDAVNEALNETEAPQ